MAELNREVLFSSQNNKLPANGNLWAWNTGRMHGGLAIKAHSWRAPAEHATHCLQRQSVANSSPLRLPTFPLANDNPCTSHGGAQWACLRWAYGPMYSRPYAYAVGFFRGDWGIRNPTHQLYGGRRRWCAKVKLWEDDKFFVKSFTATSYLPPLLVRSSSCSVLVLARRSSSCLVLVLWRT
jgi:hypothetical protein